MTGFPTIRLRRFRRTKALRSLVRETRLSPDRFVAPLFVRHGSDRHEEISSLPGVFRLSPDLAVAEARELQKLGVPAVILFGLPERKDDVGSEAWAESGAVQETVRRLKDSTPDLVVMTDVCLDEYTSHGHCGVVRNGEVDNDATLPLLAQTAVSQARAGADVVAPSDMMDGRVAAIRRALDAEGFPDVAILAYSAKSASAFYGPFREAVDSTPKFGDRRGYQMEPGNRREAMREIAFDLEEGADAVLVKPALAYLDVIREARNRFDAPIGAYNVSGEYAMVKAAAKNGWVDEKKIVTEILTGIFRAGADFVLTYHAKDAAGWIAEGSLPL
ncbi:MAG: porphobilinogen synthase [Acidobacteria bacterium]|nr:MAG: porphobilinogen synthase [Acidobacteriota bacterium]PYQ64455.1 MAG: porphobilinogen synthase [Acidobacteriota bacterium]